MKETIVKINKTKSCFFQKVNKIDKLSQTHQEKKRRVKSTKLEIKKEWLQQTMQKYTGFMSNYKAIKWTTWKKWTDSQKSSIFQD